MKKLFEIMAVLAASSMLAVAADYTPVHAEGANTFTGANTFSGTTTLSSSGPVTFDGGPSVDGVDSNEVDISYSIIGDGVIGRLNIQNTTKSVATDTDDLALRFVANNSQTQEVVWATVNCDVTDNTDTTEDATLTLKIQVAGSDTTVITVNSAGTTIVGKMAADTYSSAGTNGLSKTIQYIAPGGGTNTMVFVSGLIHTDS